MAILSCFIFQPAAYADLVTTDQLVAESAASINKTELMTLLNREDVQAQLTSRGVDITEAQDRIDSMTDAELTQILAGIDGLPAGGGVLGAILTIVLIFLILDLAGVTDVYPGV